MSVVRILLFLGVITHGILATDEEKEVYRAVVEVHDMYRQFIVFSVLNVLVLKSVNRSL